MNYSCGYGTPLGAVVPCSPCWPAASFDNSISRHLKVMTQKTLDLCMEGPMADGRAYDTGALLTLGGKVTDVNLDVLTTYFGGVQAGVTISANGQPIACPQCGEKLRFNIRATSAGNYEMHLCMPPCACGWEGQVVKKGDRR